MNRLFTSELTPIINFNDVWSTVPFIGQKFNNRQVEYSFDFVIAEFQTKYYILMTSNETDGLVYNGESADKLDELIDPDVITYYCQ